MPRLRRIRRGLRLPKAQTAQTQAPEVKDILVMIRDGYAVLVLLTLLSAYIWGLSYYDGLLSSLHVVMADIVGSRDVYSVFLRRGDFVVKLVCSLFVSGVLAAWFVVAIRSNAQASRTPWNRWLIHAGKVVSPGAMFFIAVLLPAYAANDAGKRDAEMFKADARSFQGPRGCRTIISFENDKEPWPEQPRNCASLVGVIGGRALVLVNDATYVVEVSKIRSVRFNDWPDRSVAALQLPGRIDR